MIEVFRDDSVTLFHGDAREWAGDRPDHCITDAPYSDHVQAGARARSGEKPGTFAPHALVPFGISVSALTDILETINASRWTIAFCDWRHVNDLANGCALRFARFGVWIKPDGAPQFTGDRPAQGWEAIAMLHGNDERLRWNGGGNRATWIHPVARNPNHPTPKPLPLMRELVRLFTDPGDLILDPFAGSGTTLLAARLEGRRAIGIEISSEYVEVARKRLVDLPEDKGAQTALFGGRQ